MADSSNACGLTAQVAERLKRRVRHSTDPESSAAAVLIPVARAATPYVVLTKRALHLNAHPGEVAFPGGKRDLQDVTLEAAALRETEEEIGLPRHAVDVICSLPQVVSRFGVTVTPFLGFIEESVTFTPNHDEIDSIFTVPIHWLSEQTNVQFQTFPGGQRWPFYDYTTQALGANGSNDFSGNVGANVNHNIESFRIWGITAKILTNTMNVAFDAGLQFQ